jgi:hypothetical protein
MLSHALGYLDDVVQVRARVCVRAWRQQPGVPLQARAARPSWCVCQRPTACGGRAPCTTCAQQQRGARRRARTAWWRRGATPTPSAAGTRSCAGAVGARPRGRRMCRVWLSVVCVVYALVLVVVIPRHTFFVTCYRAVLSIRRAHPILCVCAQAVLLPPRIKVTPSHSPHPHTVSHGVTRCRALPRAARARPQQAAVRRVPRAALPAAGRVAERARCVLGALPRPAPACLAARRHTAGCVVHASAASARVRVCARAHAHAQARVRA